MALNDEINQIRYQLGVLATQIDDLRGDLTDILKSDIEPKLDKALEGKANPAEAVKKDPYGVANSIKLMLIYASSERKIEAIKELRLATDLGLAKAKETIEWIQGRLGIIREEAIQEYKDSQEKEAF